MGCLALLVGLGLCMTPAAPVGVIIILMALMGAFNERAR